MVRPEPAPSRVVPDLEGSSASGAIRWALERYHPHVAFASSFGAEDVVVTDLLLAQRPDARIFTLDTGRLHEETHELAAQTRARYGVAIETLLPDAPAIESLVAAKGPFSFRESVDNRKECCALRKVEPLRRALRDCDLWITGLRREQSITRSALRKLEWDDAFGLWKLNPLADWSESQVWDYIYEHELPYNALHDRGYRSIGCAPCTRAVGPGEDVRAGRWWWERPEHRECGIHAHRGEGGPR